MLPAVNSSVMINFVVHKMEGGVASLHSPVTITHSGKYCFQPYTLGYSNLDLIKTLISFTNNIFLHKKPFLDDVCYKKGNSVSYLSFIETHLDKVSETDIIKIDKILARTVIDSELKNVLRLNLLLVSCMIKEMSLATLTAFQSIFVYCLMTNVQHVVSACQRRLT